MDDFVGFNITIVGLGIIGGSYAMALSNAGVKNIWAVDVNESVLQKAENMGIIDKGYIDARIPLEKSDIVILCIYPHLILNFVNIHLRHFKKNCIITDTAGTKARLIRDIGDVIREDMDFIGGHPMAGREAKGFEFADKDLFKDSNYILTPTVNNKDVNIEVIESIVKAIGGNIVKVNANRHDEIIAHTSQLPHITAAALMEGVKEDTHLFVAGSFNDATRVARLNGRLWAELMIDNKDNTILGLNQMESYFRRIKLMIKNEDYRGLEEMFELSRMKREEFLERCKD